jgi:alpha-soluble NSF attachment protein
MADYEQQARKNIKEAQKRLNSWSLPFIGSLNSSRYEEAAELYEKAGNMFKLAQQCK